MCQSIPPRGRLTAKEVEAAFYPLSDRYGPVIFIDQAAEIAGYTPGTLKKKLSEGCFRDSVSRGKPVRFWRDRFVMEIMNRPESSRPLRRNQAQEDRDETR